MAEKLRSKLSNFNFQQTKPVRLFEQAAEQIKNLIQSGHLKPGDKLPSESELGERLSMSRASVREALRSLESRGLIRVRPGARATVAEDALVFSSINDALESLLPRRDTVVQLLQVRGAIERFAAAQAAMVINKEQLLQLRELLNRQDRLVESDAGHSNVIELSELDVEFHLAIGRACGNAIVLEILNVLIPSFTQDNQAVVLLEEDSLAVHEHHQIYEALKGHDPDRAEREMGHHIERVISEVNKLRKDEKDPMAIA